MNANTVDFFPQHILFPTVATSHYLHQAATDILTTLKSPKDNIPLLTYGSAVTNT